MSLIRRIKELADLHEKDPEASRREAWLEGFRMSSRGQDYFIKQMQELNEEVQNRTWEDDMREYWEDVGDSLRKSMAELETTLTPAQRAKLRKELRKTQKVA